MHGVEFHGRLNLMKVAYYADRISTVSPSYAQILSHEQGCGLDGSRARDLMSEGILNGADGAVWSPAAADPLLPAPYGADDSGGKAACKSALQRAPGLARSERPAVLRRQPAHRSRRACIWCSIASARALGRGAHLHRLGSGDASLGGGVIRAAAEASPAAVAVRIGYDELLRPTARSPAAT